MGLVRCTAEGVAQFTGMALELDAGNRIFTTLPVVEVNRGRAGEAALDFAHFANGASIVSEMVFMNLETQPSGPPLSPLSSGHSSDPSCHLLLRSPRGIPSTRHCWWISRAIWWSRRTEP